MHLNIAALPEARSTLYSDIGATDQGTLYIISRTDALADRSNAVGLNPVRLCDPEVFDCYGTMERRGVFAPRSIDGMSPGTTVNVRERTSEAGVAMMLAYVEGPQLWERLSVDELVVYLVAQHLVYGTGINDRSYQSAQRGATRKFVPLTFGLAPRIVVYRPTNESIIAASHLLAETLGHLDALLPRIPEVLTRLDAARKIANTGDVMIERYRTEIEDGVRETLFPYCASLGFLCKGLFGPKRITPYNPNLYIRN